MCQADGQILMKFVNNYQIIQSNDEINSRNDE